MFKYNEKDLYDRCGVTEVPITEKEVTFSGKFGVVDGQKMPIMHGFDYQTGNKFTREICLKTRRGYIPIKNITRFRDLLDSSKYCQDETNWSFLYDEKHASKDDKEQVKKLSLSLGKHWNGK